MTNQAFDACMSRINQGDKQALHEIYEEYLSYIYSVVMAVVHNKETAEDVTSEFFIKLWTNSEKYKPGAEHKGYLATIARNMAIDTLRKQNKEILIDQFESPTGEDSDSAGLSAETILKQSDYESSPEEQVVEEMSLQDALSQLNPGEAEVINLKIMGDFTFKEISEIVNRPMGTVTWQYRTAINKLRRCGYE